MSSAILGALIAGRSDTSGYKAASAVRSAETWATMRHQELKKLLGARFDQLHGGHEVLVKSIEGESDDIQALIKECHTKEDTAIAAIKALSEKIDSLQKEIQELKHT